MLCPSSGAAKDRLTYFANVRFVTVNVRFDGVIAHWKWPSITHSIRGHTDAAAVPARW